MAVKMQKNRRSGAPGGEISLSDLYIYSVSIQSVSLSFREIFIRLLSVSPV